METSDKAPDGEAVRIGLEQLNALRALAAQVGVEIPALVNFQGKIDIEAPDADLARDLGAHCSRQPIFRQGPQIVAMNDEGELKPMTPRRFGSWVEKFISTTKFVRDKGKQHPVSIGVDLAGRLLEADGFLCRLRQLDSFFPVRLPVRRPDGTVELLPPGYDEQTRSWTEDGIEYDTEWDLDRAKDWLWRTLKDFPWGDLAGTNEKRVEKSRCASVIVAGMLGNFCRAFFPPGTPRPMIVVSGTQAGTGKTSLARMMIAPVYGCPPELSLPRADDKFDRLLEGAALGMKPFLFIDDIGKRLKSNSLNRFVTAAVHSGTLLYSQQLFEAPQMSQVVATGNDLEIDGDLARRSMLCELVWPGDIQEREFEVEITAYFLASKAFRSEALSALWAIVREHAAWRSAGVVGKRKVLKSFESYTRTVGEMLEVIGFRDPLEEPEMKTGGDKEGREVRQLLHALADAQTAELEIYTVTDLVAKARELSLLDYLVGIDTDGPLNRSERSKFGVALGKHREGVFQRKDGCFFQFGKRDGSAGSLYPCRLAREAKELE